ncbi:MAG: SigB/SigF/SigG family RNA polymerase sigma factor [Actinomycetota bacterium]
MADEQARTLDRERARELFRRIRDGEGAEKAREELVVMNYPLVEYLVRRFRGRGEPVDDLMQVASIGLLKAIDRFDIGREVEFSTYATPTIIGELKRHFRDKGWAIRVPRRLQEIGMQITKIVSALSQELGRSPTVAEIAERSGFTEDEVLEGMDTVHAYSTLSLDAPAGEEGASSIESLGSEDETLELLESWASVAPLLKKLPGREQRILYLRFFRGLTQSQIAQELDISQMHVSRLLSRTLADLRQAVGGFGG